MNFAVTIYPEQLPEFVTKSPEEDYYFFKDEHPDLVQFYLDVFREEIQKTSSLWEIEKILNLNGFGDDIVWLD